MRRAWPLLALVLLPGLGACTSRTQADAGPTPLHVQSSPDAAPPPRAPGQELLQLQADVDAIFRASCSACHAWSTATVVNLPSSCGGAGSVLVWPGDPQRSRLYGKVAHAAACGAAMPPLGGLAPSAIETIRTWIALGAPLNGQRQAPVLRAPTHEGEDLNWVSGD
jgi:cytochrome c5